MRESPLTPEELRESVNQHAKYSKNIYSKIKSAFQLGFRKLNISSEAKTIDILAPGAGAFPSFEPMIKALLERFPQLITINITLLDIDANGMKIFLEHWKRNVRTEDLQQEHKCLKQIAPFCNQMDLQKFLLAESKKDKSAIKNYDIIYFEHPVIGAMNVLMSGGDPEVGDYLLNFRAALPYLQYVLKPRAACFFPVPPPRKFNKLAD